MADEAQVKILKKGVKAWNEWREVNPETRPDLSGANFRETDLHGADLNGADLVGITFTGGNLHKSILAKANLSEADIRDVDLIGADLSQADLQGSTLGSTRFCDANLNGAAFRQADLRATDLSGANLIEADFYEADLTAANLNGATLYGTNLSRVKLHRVDLHAADLRNVDLSYAVVGFTNFRNVDLSQVKGLETVFHRGPSEITISTIYRSKGKIPFEFLRGAGVPDNFIEYMHSLVGTAFEFYSCFISYSSKDQPFAERLHADLQNKGVRCWFAPQHGKAGKKLHEQIDQAIRLHEKLLLILSQHSMKSEWVKTEIKKAAKRQTKEKKDVLFPVSLVPFDELREWECFDSDLGKDLGAEIREYLIPDFSRWKDHDSYQKAFAKLLRDLRSGKTKTV